MSNTIARRLSRAFDVEADEAGAVIAGFTLFFLLFAGYFMLRPVRETMGITGGVDNLQWLFTGTFIATLAAMPLFGWVAAKVRRRRILYWVYGSFATNLLVFGACFLVSPDNVWIARTFYIWLSVFNLIAISVAWSVLVDVFAIAQAKRLFGLMVAGASLGGLTGPLLGVLLVGAIGHAGLMLLSAALLVAAMFAALAVQHWRDARPRSEAPDAESPPRSAPLGGNPLAGAIEVLRSPYLLGIAAFMLLLASVTTFLYFEQARLVEARFPDSEDQTRVFGAIDFVVQSLSILTQLFVTGRIAHRLGIGALLVSVPLVTAAGFLWLAFAPTFAVLAVVMVVRRRRVRVRAPRSRDALHHGRAGREVQGQELQRHRGLSRRGRGQRLGQGRDRRGDATTDDRDDRGHGHRIGVGRQRRRAGADAGKARGRDRRRLKIDNSRYRCLQERTLARPRLAEDLSLPGALLQEARCRRQREVRPQ
jgi:AAA family ATP:ADP antiporter